MTKFFEQEWARHKKVNPVLHKSLEWGMEHDSQNIKHVARRHAGYMGGDDNWLGARFNDLGDEAQKNQDDPVRGIERAAATAGAVYGGIALAGAGAGAGGAAAAGAGEGAVGAGAAAGGAAAGGGAATGATNAALIESAVGTSGYGASSAGAGGATGGGFSWGRMAAQGMQGYGQGAQKEPLELEQDEVYLPDEEGQKFMVSSKDQKRPAGGRMSAVAKRGARGADPITQVGLQLGAIRELAKQIEQLERAAQGKR